MASKEINGYFYNAFPDDDFETGYDRNYSADALSDWLKTIITTGVFKTNGSGEDPQGFKVLADGLGVSVNAGYAMIEGKPAINTASVSLSLDTAPTGSSPRYDYVVLRMDNTQVKSARKTYLMTVSGTSSIPTVSQLTRTDDIYDLMLCYIKVEPNAVSIQQADITDTRGDQTLCPWSTAVKGYEDYYDAIVQQFESNVTMASAGTVVVSDIPANLYNDRFSIVEVYCNGLKEEDTAYVVGTSGGYITVTFANQKSAGAKISVILNNFIDGEGLATAISSYNEWVEDVADLKQANEHTYVCNGLNDNVEITNLVKAFVNGGTDYGSMSLKVVGNFGCMNGGQYPLTVGGSGTSASPYLIFDFPVGNRKVVLDFSDCGQISVPISGVYASIFNAGKNVTIKGLNLTSSGTSGGTCIKAFNNNSGNIICENCRFWINGYQDSLIARSGTFTNCRGSVSNVTGNSYCFLSAEIVRINGGEYYAYTGNSGSKSAVVGQSTANAVTILYGVNAPTVARSGFYQTNSVFQANSNGNVISCADLISALPLSTISGAANVRGTIALSKPSTM